METLRTPWGFPSRCDFHCEHGQRTRAFRNSTVEGKLREGEIHGFSFNLGERLKYLSSSMRVSISALLLFAFATAQPVTTRYFEFQSGFWLNLHQTLFREAVRLDSGQPIKPLDVSKLTAGELAQWNGSVSYYQQHFHGKRPVFDPELIAINDKLESAPQPNSALALPPEVQAKMMAVSALYQRVWWPEQDEKNQQWIAWAKPLVDEYGPEVVPQLEKMFQTTWPANRVRVDVSYFVAEIGGAYTTDDPPHITLSSVRIPQDWYGLEVVFHEGGHPLAEKLEKDLSRECAAQKKQCNDLWHAVQFYTVGDVMRRTLAKRGIAYDSYAEHNGLYRRGDWPKFKRAIDQAWPQYLEGKADWNTSVRALVTAYQN